MGEDSAQRSNAPLFDFNSPKAPPTILVLGSLILRGIAWWEDIDFILSIREERIAMTLQLFLDWGWLILAVVGIVLWLGAHRVPPDPTKVHWGMVASVGILTFIAGALITVHAIGSTPAVLTQWGGDANAKTCSAVLDTSRLAGYKDKDRIILLCGVSDPMQDPIEDARIAVSQPFTITGQGTSIVASYGAMDAAVRQAEDAAKAAGQVPAPNQNLGFILWHAVALIPKDLNVSEIKRVSDVAKRGGKILTEPQAGAYGSAQAIIQTQPVGQASAKEKQVLVLFPSRRRKVQMLKNHMDAKENALVAISQVPANAGHTLHKGTPREAFIKEFLESHLPENVAIGTGEIIDANSQPNTPRNQFDIVIYRKSFPKLDFGGGISGFLIESVIATIEVKSVLTQGELENAAKAASTSKSLAPNTITSFHTGFIPPKILNYVVAYDGPASMQTVYGWLAPIHTALGIAVPNLPVEPAQRMQTPSPSVDGIFILRRGFTYFDNVPYGFASDTTRQANPTLKWVSSNTASGNLLLFFLFLQSATANVEARWLNPLPYLQGFQLPNIMYGT